MDIRSLCMFMWYVVCAKPYDNVIHREAKRISEEWALNARAIAALPVYFMKYTKQLSLCGVKYFIMYFVCRLFFLLLLSLCTAFLCCATKLLSTFEICDFLRVYFIYFLFYSLVRIFCMVLLSFFSLPMSLLSPSCFVI